MCTYGSFFADLIARAAFGAGAGDGAAAGCFGGWGGDEAGDIEGRGTSATDR